MHNKHSKETINHEEQEVASQLNSSKTLYQVAMVASPVSLFLGGLILSIVAVICGGAAMSKATKIIKLNSIDSQIKYSANELYAKAKVALIFGLVALVLNAISIAIVLPAIIQFVQNPDIEALQSMLNASSISGLMPSAGSSTWG